MSLTVLLLNFPDETASILESVLGQLISRTCRRYRCRWFKRTAQHGKVEDSEGMGIVRSVRSDLKSPDRIRFEAKPKSDSKRQSRRVSTLWSSLCVRRHSFGVFWIWCQGYQGLNWLNHVQSTRLFWKCSKLSYVM